MTEEYKKDVLNYMTGKLTPGNQTSNSFRSEEIINNDLLEKLTELGITPTYSTKTLCSENNSNIILYDSYIKNNKTYSYIAILNQKGEVLDVLTTYESGTLIEFILELNYDENGNIYGIDFPTSQDKLRIILLNNISVPIENNFVCKLRASYYINTDFDASATLGTRIIRKVPGEARYYLFGYELNNTETRKTKLIEFSNIVGVPVEWKYYTGKTIGNAYTNAGDFIITTLGEKQEIDYYYHLDIGGVNIDHEFFDGETLTTKTTITAPNIVRNLVILNNNFVYFACVVNNGNSNYTVFVYKAENNTTTELFNYSVIGNYPLVYLSVVNGILFCKTENSQTINNVITYKVKCAVYYNNQAIISPSYEFTDATLIRTVCNVQKMFNLYAFIIVCQNQIRKPKIVIYDNQYNGFSYQNYNSLIPAHSEIYSNGYIQFARDLYNKQVFENQTLAVVNVPFNYLNDMTISPSNLLGQTMTTLVNDKRDISKNKYENVYINFLNKLNVIDEDINQYYPLTANYINTNINVGTSANYNISKLTKVRINFSTPQIISINWTKYYSYYKTTFEVQIEDEIPTSIDFISEDETTTYITKEYHFHKNKNYMISEKVRIGESLQREELMYNNQNVLYNHNQVMVYEKE